MSDYTITITSAEEKALKTVMVDIKEWITNFKEVRATQATSEITKILLEHCNANNISLATGVEAQIDQAYSLGLVAEAKADQLPPAAPEE
tara:strand:+ start:353 stop:622 length:270 start_codon:yes stop_codon:yes gene_type:complete